MQASLSHITKQLILIRLIKIVASCLIAVSFGLEFALLNFVAIHKEEKITVHSYQEVSGELVSITDTITVTLADEYRELFDYIRKKQEDQTRNQSEEYKFGSFHLFFSKQLSFDFVTGSCLEKPSLLGHYQVPDVVGSYRRIFHPPIV